MALYDCFMYFDEDMLLDIRLNTLNNIVDKFIIAERKTTYVSDSKFNKYWIQDLIEVKQDPDVKDKKGTQPAKYYAKDAEGDEMSKSTKSKRDAHFKKGAAKSDDDPSAYKPAPGDKGAETKPSKHTKKFKQMFGEKVDYFTLAGLKKQLKKEYGSKASSLKIVKVKGGVSIQTPSGNELERYEGGLYAEGQENRKINAEKLQSKYPDRSRMIFKRTDEAHKDIPDGHLDFVFIDADHTYEGVKKDIELWEPKVHQNGLIIGHDLNWGGVARAVGECFSEFWISADNVWASPKCWYNAIRT